TPDVDTARLTLLPAHVPIHKRTSGEARQDRSRWFQPCPQLKVIQRVPKRQVLAGARPYAGFATEMKRIPASIRQSAATLLPFSPRRPRSDGCISTTWSGETSRSRASMPKYSRLQFASATNATPRAHNRTTGLGNTCLTNSAAAALSLADGCGLTGF